MEKKKIKYFLIILSLSVLLFLATFWTAGISFDFAAGVESLCYIVFTWYMCHKYTKCGMSCAMIATAIVIGRIFLETPIRIVDFNSTLISLSVPIICLASIGMGVLCFKKNKIPMWTICIALILIYSVFIPKMWYYHFR